MLSRKNKKLIRLNDKMMETPDDGFSSDVHYQLMGRKKLESDLKKLTDFMEDLNNRPNNGETRLLIRQTKLKIKLVQKELDKEKTFVW
jgi:hypothetical protein